MKKKCKIRIKEIEIIFDLLTTQTAELIWNKLPLKTRLNTWGKEIYFSCDIDANLENNAKSIMKLGEIAFWPEGKVIAIGFGPTPISIEGEIRLAADCNVWATTDDSMSKLDIIQNGEIVELFKL